LLLDINKFDLIQNLERKDNGLHHQRVSDRPPVRPTCGTKKINVPAIMRHLEGR